MNTVVKSLSEMYGFDAEDAMRRLNSTIKKMKLVLPFCGKKREENCESVKLNHGLYTQCQNKKTEDEKCKTCGKKDGKFGTIEERMKMTNEEFEEKYKVKITNYRKIMDKMSINEEEAKKEAAELGWTIPEKQFEVQKSKRGRPKKSVIVSDSDEEEKPKKSRGRPKKEKKVVESTNPGDDLIATLVANAKEATNENTSSSEESDSSSENENVENVENVEKKEKKEKKKRAPKKSNEEKEAEKQKKKEEKEAEKTKEKGRKGS